MENTPKEKEEKKYSISEDVISPILIAAGEVADAEEILSREVKPFGSGSAHVLIPKKHIGKQARIFIKRSNVKLKNQEEVS